MAKRRCRTSDWYVTPRVSRSPHCLRRGASEADHFRLCGLLQSSSHALSFTERCTHKTGCPTVRKNHWRPRPDRAASPICPDMIFGRDSGPNYPMAIRLCRSRLEVISVRRVMSANTAQPPWKRTPAAITKPPGIGPMAARSQSSARVVSGSGWMASLP